MKTTKILIWTLLILSLTACDKDDEIYNSNSDLLTGYWVNPNMSDTIWTYERAENLKDQEYGLAFKSGKVFIERKNAGWCGTPPISYGDYEGTWIQSDSIINITVEYWGGLIDYQWKIISLDNDKLKIYRIKEEAQSTD